MTNNTIDISKFEHLAAQLPPDGYLRIEHLATNKKKGRIGITGLSEPTIWRRSREGSFPQAVKIGPRTTGWLITDIRQWLRNPKDYQQRKTTPMEDLARALPLGPITPAPLSSVIYPEKAKTD